MSRHNGTENPWVMSPSPTQPGYPHRNGPMPIKKESWRPGGAAQSSWTPTEPRGKGPARQGYAPSNGQHGQGSSSAAAPPRSPRRDGPPTAPGRAGQSERRGSKGGDDRRGRMEREQEKGKDERSWSAWNRKTGAGGNGQPIPSGPAGNDRLQRGREDDREPRRRIAEEEDRYRRREPEIIQDRREPGNSYRPPDAVGQRRPWGSQDRPSFAPPPPPGPAPRSDWERPPASSSANRGGRASPDYGVGSRDRDRTEERAEKRARSRSRDERPHSPRHLRELSPHRSQPPRAASPILLPPQKRAREHSPSSSSTTSPRHYPQRRDYSSTSSSRSISPYRRRDTSQSHPRGPIPHPPPSATRHPSRRSPSPPRFPIPPPSPPRHPQAHHRHPPPTAPRQLSPPRQWGRPALPDQKSVFSHAPPHTQSHSQPPPLPPVDAGPGRQASAPRRDRWAEGVARGQDDHPPHPPPPPRAPSPASQSTSRWPGSTSSTFYRPEPRMRSPPPPQSTNGYHPPNQNGYPSHMPPPLPVSPPRRPAAIKIDLSLARAPLAKSSVQHLFDDRSTPSTPTTAGLSRSSPPYTNGHSFPQPPPPIHNHPPPPPTPPLIPAGPPPALPPFPPTRPPTSASPAPFVAPTPQLDTLAAHQQSYSDHLNSIAPYVQAAFRQWLEQNTSPALPEFLVHYFGRPPTDQEVEQIQQLLELKRKLTADERELGVEVDKGQEKQLRDASPVKQTVILPPPTPPTSVEVKATSRLPPGEVYERLACVGEGTYGKVYKAKNVESGVFVAMKRIRMEGEKDGFPVTAMREIKLLQGLKHDNVIDLVEMMVSKGSVYMIFEYMEHDLTGLLAHPDLKFSPANIKSLNYQMLDGLAYLHDRSILHRDLKGSNILLDGSGVLKLADFGLARFYSKKRRDDYTNRVITLWYRSPELLLGETVYGPEVDIWSAGCIMLELFVTKPIFQGTDEISQLETIYVLLGTPSPASWPQLLELPWYELVRPKTALPDKFRESFKKWLSPAALDLAVGLLMYDPAKRVGAREALSTAYFTEEEPGMEMPTQLRKYGEQHEMDAKVHRRKKRESAGGSGAGEGR